MELKDKYILFIKHLITPTEKRKETEKTTEQFCEYYGITPEDIAEIEGNPNFYQDLEKETRNWGVQQLPTIIQKAFTEASRTGKPAAVRAFKELITENKNAGGVNLSFTINPSDEQWARIVERERRKIKAIEVE